MSKGDIIDEECPHCGGSHVEYITRVTGFFSKVGSWNKGKIAELKDRRSAIEGNRELVSDTISMAEEEGTREIKLFWKEGCPRCPEAKALAKELEGRGYRVEHYDIESSEGLAESSLYMVMATPTMVAVDGEGEEATSWRGSVPELKEVESALVEN